MTLATLFVALIATAAAENTGDPVLLDFHASWCGPCRQMRPEVEKLVQKGYPVKSIDIDRSPEMSERYNITAVPAFVVVDAQGKALARTKGAMPAKLLAQFYNEAKTKQTGPVEEPEDRDQRPVAEADAPAEPMTPGPAPLVNPKPWATVVRIKMHLSDTEWGFGSGTVIHSTAEESIILTCAHIFRVKGQQQPSPRNFRVPITVDLFDGQIVGRQPAMVNCSEKDLPGEAIDYDFSNDVGLIRIRPGRTLPSSRVVPPWWHPKKGMKMYTVGCSHGHDATAWDTTILEPRVGMSNTQTKQSFATIKCAHQPKEGRSGGGLYTTDGYVAGVCDFADPNEGVGLYAVPEAIHRLLDRNQLMALYKPTTEGTDATLLAKNRTRSNTIVRGQSPTDPDAVTLPPPQLVGITTPAATDNKTWRSPASPPTAPRAARSTARPEPMVADSVDPGPRSGTALPTDIAMDPGPEARAFEDTPEPPPARRTPTPDPTPARTSKGWKGRKQALPDLVGADRPSR